MMSVPKNATSEARNESMPAWAGVRFVPSGTGGSAARTATSVSALVLILPVRVVGVLDVPQRSPASHHGDLLEVVRRRRRRRRPLQRPGVPRVVAGHLAVP